MATAGPKEREANAKRKKPQTSKEAHVPKTRQWTTKTSTSSREQTRERERERESERERERERKQ